MPARKIFVRVLLSLLSIVLLLVLFVLLWARWTLTPEEILVQSRKTTTDFSSAPKSGGSTPAPLRVLLDTTDSNVFAPYITEILKAEGILSFDPLNLATSSLDSSDLFSRRLVIIATRSSRLTMSKPLIDRYVDHGGRILMIDPPAEFDSLLGIRDLSQGVQGGYVQIDSSTSAVEGIPAVRLQFFGTARLCMPTTSVLVTRFLNNDPHSPSHPAMGINTFAKGKAAYFLYDLGRSVVFTRQGMPPGVLHDKDGDGVMRTSDLFHGTFTYSQHRIPQADLHQKLFIRMIDYLLEEDFVLPRIWYFPNGEPSIAVITGDSHYTPTPVIQRLVNYIESKGGRFSLIDYADGLDTVLAASLISHGHSIGPHIYHPRPDNKFPLRVKLWITNWGTSSYFFHPRFQDLSDETNFAVATFRQRAGYKPRFTRTHFLSWWGWSQVAELFAQGDLQMDFSITGMNPHEQVNLPFSNDLKSPVGFGYINGSGLPMKFINPDGRLVNLFEQPTQVEDDVIGAGFVRNPPDDSLTTQEIIGANRALINESIRDYHTALVYNFHPEHTVLRFPPSTPLSWEWVTSTIDYLATRHVPMISADSWLNFVQARYSVKITGVTFSRGANSGSFAVFSPSSVKGLTILLPCPTTSEKQRSATAHDLGQSRNSYPLTVSSITVNHFKYLQIMLDLSAGQATQINYSF